jgi:hypothetical protein
MALLSSLISYMVAERSVGLRKALAPVSAGETASRM